MEEFHGILSVPLHVRPVNEWPMWLRAKLRVDEASLRRRELDALPKLDQIAAAKRADPALDL